MVRLHIAITTYNRAESLNIFLKELSRQIEEFNLSANVYIHDDMSDMDKSLFGRVDPNFAFDVYYSYRTFRCGKRKFWMIINDIFREARAMIENWDYFLLLQDDITVEPNFLSEAVAVFSAIKDPFKTLLNLLLVHSDRGQTQWTGIRPVKIDCAGFPVYKVGWTDCAFIANHRALYMLDWRMIPISEERWELNPLLGSGVGPQISERILKSGSTMYQVGRHLIHHGELPSLMNPEARTLNPMIC